MTVTLDTNVLLQAFSSRSGASHAVFRLSRMGNNTHTLTIRVPEVLKNRIERVSALQGVSINQFALYAFTKEIAELENRSYFDAILSKINKKQLLRAVDEILAAVPERPVPEWDRLPETRS